MSERLRGLVARKLSLIGPQLQVFWRKTLTSGHLLKQAFSPQSSPQSTNFPTTRQIDDPSQATLLPVFDTQGLSDRDAALGKANEIILPQETKCTRTASATDLSIQKLYANVSTQTESLMIQTSGPADGGPNNNSLDEYGEAPLDHNDPQVDVDTSSTHCDPPEILDGSSELIVTEFNDKSHLAILVTREMIERLKRISKQSSELGHLEARVEEAQRDVDWAAHNVQYCEDLIEEAEPESQENIAKLREDLEQRQRTLDRQKARRDALEPELVINKRNVSYQEGLFQDMFQQLLSRAGLLETPSEHPNQDDADEEANGGDSFELHPYEVDSAHSEVSIDELTRRAANEEVKQRRAELLEVEHEFDTRHDTYAYESARLQQRLLEGNCALTQTEFDLTDFETTREITRDLAAAEDAYEEALARRNKLGPNNWDQESGFVEEEYDGYPLSWEDEAVVSAPTDSIYKWLEDVPDVEDIPSTSYLGEGPGGDFGLEEPQGIEDWDIRSAGMSDAWSCYDWTRNRRRIDRWRKITGRIR